MATNVRGVQIDSENAFRPGDHRSPGLSHFVVLASIKTNTLAPLSSPSGRSGTPVPDQVSVGRRRVRKQEQDEVVRLYISGMGTRDVAARLGIGKTTVLNILVRRGIDRRAVGKHHRLDHADGSSGTTTLAH